MAADWLDFLREKVRSNQDRTQAEFRFFALKNQAAWLTPTSDEGPNVEAVVPGTCVMLSQNMQDLLRKILQSLDCTWVLVFCFTKRQKNPLMAIHAD